MPVRHWHGEMEDALRVPECSSYPSVGFRSRRRFRLPMRISNWLKEVLHGDRKD